MIPEKKDTEAEAQAQARQSREAQEGPSRAVRTRTRALSLITRVLPHQETTEVSARSTQAALTEKLKH